jgi:hypothetical protein
MLGALRRRAPRSRAVLLVGLGMWDLVFSAERDVVGWFEARFRWLLTRLLALAHERYETADVLVRNMFPSFRRGGLCGEGEAVDHLVALNDGIARSLFGVRDAMPASMRATLRLHLLDAFNLSWGRRAEMPAGPEGDGLHWGCMGRSGGGQCTQELHTGSQRPDEVSWAAMQVAMLQACGNY